MNRRMVMLRGAEVMAVVTLTGQGKLHLSGEHVNKARRVISHYAGSGARGEELFDMLLRSLAGHWHACEVDAEAGPGPDGDDDAERLSEGDAPAAGTADPVDVFTQGHRRARRCDD